MIDSANETLISLADAAKELPRRRRGRKTHVLPLPMVDGRMPRESSWRPSKSAEPVARPERHCNGSLNGSHHPSRPGPLAEANPGRSSAVGPSPNVNARRRRPVASWPSWGPEP